MAAHINVKPVPPSPDAVGHRLLTDGQPGGGGAAAMAWMGDTQEMLFNVTGMAMEHYIVEPTCGLVGLIGHYAMATSTRAYHVWLNVRDFNLPAIYEPGGVANTSLVAMLVIGFFFLVHKIAHRVW